MHTVNERSARNREKKNKWRFSDKSDRPSNMEQKYGSQNKPEIWDKDDHGLPQWRNGSWGSCRDVYHNARIIYLELYEEGDNNFIQRCINCIVSQPGEVMITSFQQQYTEKNLIEVVHVDLFYGSSDTESKHVLNFRDELRSFLWLRTTYYATSWAEIDGTETWYGTFGFFEWIVKDQSPHSTSTRMKNMAVNMMKNHHFI